LAQAGKETIQKRGLGVHLYLGNVSDALAGRVLLDDECALDHLLCLVVFACVKKQRELNVSLRLVGH
jgi:hypothetical protein